MDIEEYQRVRAWGGKLPSVWCERLNISRDADKSYSSGRLRISDKVADKVAAYAASKKEKAGALQATLGSVLAGWTVTLDEASLDITIGTPDGGFQAVFSNAGMNNFLQEIYHFGPPRKNPHTLIFGKSSDLSFGAQVGGGVPQWFLWSARLKSGDIGRLNNYPHIITPQLLAACDGFPAI